MGKVITFIPQPNFRFLYLLFLFFLASCASKPNWAPAPYEVHSSTLQEIEQLSDNSKYEIYSLMTRQCLYAEYNGIPCVYPQINYPANQKAIK